MRRLVWLICWVLVVGGVGLIAIQFELGRREELGRRTKVLADENRTAESSSELSDRLKNLSRDREGRNDLIQLGWSLFLFGCIGIVVDRIQRRRERHGDDMPLRPRT